jgi:hypothetical protein
VTRDSSPGLGKREEKSKDVPLAIHCSKSSQVFFSPYDPGPGPSSYRLSELGFDCQLCQSLPGLTTSDRPVTVAVLHWHPGAGPAATVGFRVRPVGLTSRRLNQKRQRMPYWPGENQTAEDRGMKLRLGTGPPH